MYNKDNKDKKVKDKKVIPHKIVSASSFRNLFSLSICLEIKKDLEK